MDVARECLCCHELDGIEDKLDHVSCVTEHEGYTTVCLNREVLDTTLVGMAQLTGEVYPNPVTNRYCSSALIHFLINNGNW